MALFRPSGSSRHGFEFAILLKISTGYNMNFIQQTAGLVINSDAVNFSSHFNCSPEARVRGSDIDILSA